MGKSKPISIRLSEDDLHFVDKRARSNNISRSEAIAEIIRESREGATTKQLQSQIDELRATVEGLQKKLRNLKPRAA
jgi:metal-responsive CopG/Arc/MetJ family transcriptional regulator